MFLELRKAQKRIAKLYKDNKNPKISDNYHLIYNTYINLKRRKKELNSNFELLKIASEYAERNNFSFSKAAYIACMKKLSKTRELDKPTLEIMPCMLLAYTIIEISNNSENLDTEINFIRSVSRTDFSQFDAELFISEKFLTTEEQYLAFTDETKSRYRSELSKYAKKYNLTHKDAEAHIKESGKSIGEVLFPEKRNPCFFFVCGILFLLLFAIYYKTIGVWSLILGLPLWHASGEITDMLISKYIKKDPVLRIDPNKVETDEKTLVVITSLITDNDSLFDNIELYYLANKSSPSLYGLLLDHPDSNVESDEKTIERTEKAKRKIAELNEKYNGRFYLFLRDRVKGEDDTYYGWERKRGAVTELVRFLYDENTTIKHFVGNKTELKNVKYILTLDSDTTLTLESVNEIMGAMMHPRYRPKVKNGRVVKGYGIMQPKMRTSIESASKTPFSAMMGGGGGTDIYESASYDRYMTAFNEGAFCGKGIIDVKLFHELADLPEGFVLSHDLPEGALMRTLSLCDVTLSDSTPKNMLSYATRNARWCRGDVQNLWLLRRIKSKIGRFMILANLSRLLSPILSLFAIILSLFWAEDIAKKTVLLSVITLVLPFAFSVLMTQAYFVNLTKRRTFSKITKNTLLQIGVTLYKVLSLCYMATVNLFSLVRSTVRMTLTKKHRLEWITASEMDRSGKGGFWYYVQRMISSCIIGAALFFFGNIGLMRFIGICWFFFPVLAYAQSLPKLLHTATVSKNEAKEHLSLMYRFFEENVNSSSFDLPPDNISFFPTERVAMRTSPTNIGLYLLSTVCAADMSVISKDEMKIRLENSLKTIESLDKWNGHLYNWYDLENLNVLGGKYVSTVDSGNFIACVLVLVESLKEYRLFDLVSRYENLTKADMTKLYNRERELFYLGYDGEREKYGDICYDLYMSEARTTSYFSCAIGAVPKKHWKTLSRTLLEEKGYLGMASWTGTAFEYFMPMIFLPDIANSFPSEALKFAYHRQLDYSTHNIYGISESGYYSFDHDMNYQYKAFGVPNLGLKHYSESEYVFSPYSTYLMMYMSPKRASKNLRELKKLGMFGKYGFYEAIDFRSVAPKVIKSYMSHHVGMSICALTNLAKDNILQKRFMNNKSMRCAHELLEERIPDIGIYKKAPHDHPKRLTQYELAKVTETEQSENEFEIGAVDGTGLSIIAASNGNVSLCQNEILINDCNFSDPSPDKTIKICSVPSSRMEQNDNTVSNIYDDVWRSVTYGVCDNCFFVELKTGEGTNELDFDVVLEKKKEFYSHSSFSRLFVTSEYDEKTNTLFFVRRNRKNANLLYLAIARLDQSPFKFKTRRNGDYGETGGTLYPSLHAEGCQGEKKTIFLLTVSKTMEQAIKNILAARNDFRPSGRTIKTILSREMIKNIVSRPQSFKNTALKRDVLYQFGISGDNPLIFIKHPSPTLLREYLCAFAELSAIGERCDLVVSAEDEDEYTKETTRLYKKIVREMGCEHFLSKKGGIYILSRIDDEKSEFLELFSINRENEILAPQYIDGEITKKEFPIPQDSFRTDGGYFLENGYTVITDEVKDTVWSFVLTGTSFGTIVTHKSLGFSYYRNSTNGRSTRFDGDIYSEKSGEYLYAYFGKKRFDLIKCASSMYVSPDLVIYSGTVNGNNYKVYVTVSAKYPIKFMRVVSDSDMDLEYNAFGSDKESVYSMSGSASSLVRENAFAVGTIGKCRYTANGGIGVRREGNDIVFFLVGGKTQTFCESLREKIDINFYQTEQKKEKTPLPPIKIKFGATWIDSFANAFLPYQVIASRFRARSGFFQSSGAFGYRDQLQDIMMLCYSDPSLARTHIIRCGARQYEDGSVNHWFFAEGDCVKTKCSDDFMYLPLAVAHYIELSGDESVLDVECEYLASPPLNGKSERYEKPQKSGKKESIYEHCKRSLSYSLKRGKHGLPPLGSCDWNDGFSHFGEKGIGESVLNAMQYVWVYEKFAPIMIQKGEKTEAQFYLDEAKRLRGSAEKCFETDRFIRAYGDNGEKLGSAECDECKIDLTVQAFSVIANIGTKEMQRKALDTMWNELFDEEYQILRLFSPPFVKNDRHVGYIQGYIRGIRENGGQYTHAAVWALIALCEFGMQERAKILLRALTPSWRMSVGGKITSAYKSEPYALCGDVYYSPKFKGRGGWSHYTGSAGWFYRALIENVMGIKLDLGKRSLTIAPKFEYETELSYFGKVKIISKQGNEKVLLDGNEITMPIILDGNDHQIEVFTEKIHRIDR